MQVMDRSFAATDKKRIAASNTCESFFSSFLVKSSWQFTVEISYVETHPGTKASGIFMALAPEYLVKPS